LASQKPLTKRSDPDPYPYENVTDPQHWIPVPAVLNSDNSIPLSPVSEVILSLENKVRSSDTEII
jgi:hypothetical protein